MRSPAALLPARPSGEEGHKPVTWRDLAACRGLPVDVFFSPDGERADAKARRERAAKEVCAVCPVRADCFEYAVARPEKFGVFGGADQEAREKERKKRLRVASTRARKERQAS
jgi:WhiB family redox-sensing transcriptional regulator